MDIAVPDLVMEQLHHSTSVFWTYLLRFVADVHCRNFIYNNHQTDMICVRERERESEGERERGRERERKRERERRRREKILLATITYLLSQV